MGREGEGNICLDTMDSFPCHICISGNDIKHVTSAFQPYEVCILVHLQLATLASAIAIMYKTSLGFAASLVAKTITVEYG